MHMVLALQGRQTWIHIASVHEGKKHFKCNICDAGFTQKASMNGHISSVHEGKKPFKCSMCDASFSGKRKLNEHIVTVHEKNNDSKCDACDARFTKKTSLNSHIASVHVGKKPFYCDICGASYTKFGVESSCCVHSWRKEGFQVWHLWEKFCKKRNLSLHERKRPFNCNICGTNFTSNHNLKKHIGSIHE